VELPNNTRRVYLYDFAGRLASGRQEQTSTGNLIVEQTYQYDALDRIEKETVEPEPAFFTVPVALMTHDADDRLDTFNGLQCMSDLDGNLVTGPLGGNVAGFTFDARNRLTAVGNATFVYDSEGRRISKTENGTTTVYVHDLQSALSRLLSASTGNATTFYVYTPGGMLLFEDTPSTIGLRVPHHDYRGSTEALSNTTGTVIGRVVYGTYGEVISRTGDTDSRFLFNGAYGVETDANGLCLMRARYYSAETRRFLNADPIGFAGGTNWYGFALGAPGNLIDPFGLAVLPTDFIGPLLPGDQRGLTPQQDAALRELLRRETTGGSRAAAEQSSNTFGDDLLRPFNSSDAHSVPTPAGDMDLDWFTDIRARGDWGGGYTSAWAYPIAKLIWTAIRASEGVAIGSPWPWQDPGERVAYVYLLEGVWYSTLFDEEFFRKYGSRSPEKPKP